MEQKDAELKFSKIRVHYTNGDCEEYQGLCSKDSFVSMMDTVHQYFTNRANCDGASIILHGACIDLSFVRSVKFESDWFEE